MMLGARRPVDNPLWGSPRDGGHPARGLAQRLVGGSGLPARGLSPSVRMSRQARQAGAHARNVATLEPLGSQNFVPRCLIHLDTFRGDGEHLGEDLVGQRQKRCPALGIHASMFLPRSRNGKEK